MHMFLWELLQKGYQNRKVAIVENGSWAPSAGREMKALLETMKNITIIEPMITIRGSITDETNNQLETLANNL